MNLNSEIEFFAELRLVDKARLLNLFLHELAEEARATYGPGAEQVHDGAHLRFVNELYHRLTRVIEQLLAEEATRPGRRRGAAHAARAAGRQGRRTAGIQRLRPRHPGVRELRYDGADGLVSRAGREGRGIARAVQRGHNDHR